MAGIIIYVEIFPAQPQKYPSFCVCDDLQYRVYQVNQTLKVQCVRISVENIQKNELKLPTECEQIILYCVAGITSEVSMLTS